MRSTFYRLAMITGAGAAGDAGRRLEERTRATLQLAWAVDVRRAGRRLFLLFGALAPLVVLPRPAADRPGERARSARASRGEFLAVFGSFFRKPRIARSCAFLLLYRFAEAQLVKLVTPFLLDARADGGLGLTTSEVGFVYGTVGVVALTLGGILGGGWSRAHGLKALAVADGARHPPAGRGRSSTWPTPSPRARAHQRGGGGRAVRLRLRLHRLHALHDPQSPRGEHKTAHYAICTGFMALGMMLPGMWSGWLQDQIGYRHFFVWVILATVPSFLVVLCLPLEAGFGTQGRRMSAVTLRPYAPADAPAMAAAAAESVAEVQPWLPWCHPGYSVEEARTWIDAQALEREAGTAYEFAVFDERGRYVGACGLNQVDRTHRRANLGYWLRTAATGRGYMTEAVRALAAWAFAHTDLVRLEILVAVGNARSERVAERRAPSARACCARGCSSTDGPRRHGVLAGATRSPAGLSMPDGAPIEPGRGARAHARLLRRARAHLLRPVPRRAGSQGVRPRGARPFRRARRSRRARVRRGLRAVRARRPPPDRRGTRGHRHRSLVRVRRDRARKRSPACASRPWRWRP